MKLSEMTLEDQKKAIQNYSLDDMRGMTLDIYDTEMDYILEHKELDDIFIDNYDKLLAFEHFSHQVPGRQSDMPGDGQK